MATRNINLTDALDRFVSAQIESGTFQNASEVVRAGLRLLRAQEDERAARLQAIANGPQSEEYALSMLTTTNPRAMR
jgi:putative addiction module CopG family antidote